MSALDPGTETFRWHQQDGELVTCVEKLKVLAENVTELRQLAQDAFEDALLMGCDEAQLRDVFAGLMRDLRNPYRK
ncbi:MAG: hypothetical protein JNJ97_15835 [Alphaproteobacteria bacterium]|nr:hypothetical protein [Alphaproteobacteria bacterium]MCA0452185.1 hypothetical protein [Pseudomonadota bacterium]